MRARRILISIIAVAALSTLMVGCRGRHHGGEELDATTIERRAVERTNWVLDDLDATDAQREQVLAEVKALVPDVVEIQKQRKPTREALVGELLESKKPDAEKVHGKVDEISGNLVKFGHEVADRALVIHGILTPEQRAALVDELPEPEEGFKGGWMLDAAVDRGLDELDASDAQAELVLDHKERLVAEVPGLQRARSSARRVFVAQLRSDKPDGKKVHATIDRTAAVFTAFGHKVADAALEIAPTLTDAQRKAIRTRMAEHRRR